MSEAFEFDLDPVSFITVGTVGPPGKRTFYLQASRGRQVVSLVLEKEQAIALAEGIGKLFERLGQEEPERFGGLRPAEGNYDLLMPVEPAFRIGEMSLGIDEDAQRVVLVAESIEDEGERARFTADYDQMLAVAKHTADVALHGGRELCPLCGEPMEPEGHFCPRRNGHAKA